MSQHSQRISGRSATSHTTVVEGYNMHTQLGPCSDIQLPSV